DHRWSEPVDLLAGVEEIGIRVLASSVEDGVDIPAELFGFGRLVSSNAELELAVGSKLGEPSAKVTLVERLLAGSVSEQTVAIVSHLVQQPRGRRIGALLKHAAGLVADQASLTIATITVAAPLDDTQLERLKAGLSSSYGALRIQQVIDPSVLGGVRIVVGDDVIDDTIATRLKDLRLQLAG
ncbi:MAG: F0F1 ATP synthase subunit delta, partial [Terrimesophilobacter sp.]